VERSEHRLSEAGSPGLHAGEEVITVYSKPGCSGCEEVKSKLRNAQIPLKKRIGLISIAVSRIALYWENL